LILLLVLGAAAAGIVAVASRAPASVRAVPEGGNNADPSLGATFTDAEVARHGTYRRGGYVAYAVGTLLSFAALVILAKGPAARFVDRISEMPGGWPVKVLLTAGAVSIALFLVALPLAYVRFHVDRSWGIATQETGAWLVDQARSLAVGAVISAPAALFFYGLVRSTRGWWLWAWGIFTVLTLLLTFLWPILIAPIFNKFTPLEEGPLRTRILALASDAGVDLQDVLVADASKRTTAENAYVAGIGSSKRLVLYDTLLNKGRDEETLFVISHELGHKVHNDIVKGLALSSLGMLVFFLGMAWLERKPDFWNWTGAEGIADPKALPLILLAVSVATLVSLPILNAFSRHVERQADTFALDLTDDPDAAVGLFRRLAFSNLSDLRPPAALEWLLFSHPAIPDRIEDAVAD
jgi:STE24 endopeptidase